MINGIIIIHKEKDFTSHDVVAKMRGICGQRKIGHTGTLDPAATGVLPVCLGSATKLCDMLTDKSKEYVAELLLGVETDTQDTTGTVLKESPVEVTEEEVRVACSSFVGEYAQVPPMYSALKVNGKKLYDLARAGIEVEREARMVEISELEILEIDLPVVKMRVACSKGTYIRTLCADIGARLGCGGTMKSLQRTRVGGFDLKAALTLGELQKLKDEGRLLSCVQPVDQVFAAYPALHACDEAVKLLENGNPLYVSQTREKLLYEEGMVRVYFPDDRFAGVFAYNAEKKLYMPYKMFLEKE